MVIFNSYVKLPEGIFRSNPPRWSPDVLPSGVLGDAFGSSPESAERFGAAELWMVAKSGTTLDG